MKRLLSLAFCLLFVFTSFSFASTQPDNIQPVLFDSFVERYNVFLFFGDSFVGVNPKYSKPTLKKANTEGQVPFSIRQGAYTINGLLSNDRVDSFTVEFKKLTGGYAYMTFLSAIRPKDYSKGLVTYQDTKDLEIELEKLLSLQTKGSINIYGYQATKEMKDNGANIKSFTFIWSGNEK